MIFEFPRLPFELRQHVIGYLPIQTKRDLSSTNSEYRGLLAPGIFKAIRITNDPKDAALVRELTTKYGASITKLRFETSIEHPQVKNFDSNSDTADGLSEPVRRALSGEYLPNLKCVVIHIEYDYEGLPLLEDYDDPVEMGFNTFENDETEEDVRNEEARYEWRAFMAAFWRALASNPTVSCLVVEDLIPKATSTFGLSIFHKFLAQLAEFDISILGMDNGAGWNSNVLDGYRAFLSRLDQYFFRHLSSVSSLKLSASRDCAIGHDDYFHVKLALKPKDLPALERLELENVFVGRELTAFVVDHARSLKSLILNHARCRGDEYDSPPYFWANFFDAFRRAEPILSSLIIRPEEAEDVCPLNWIDPGLLASVESMRAILNEDSRKRLFCYSILDEKYGYTADIKSQVVERCLDGNDQRAYNELLRLVEMNRIAEETMQEQN